MVCAGASPGSTDNGLPETRLRTVLSPIVRVPFTRVLVAEERGLRVGLAVGQCRVGCGTGTPIGHSSKRAESVTAR
ncbi:Uncharacterised protein [Nocardia brasiliensis]|nr:Uncharacterised protein [Nocardia brasiliensis]